MELPTSSGARRAKHAVWLVIAWWTGGAWVLYFADAPTLVRRARDLHRAALAYVWIAILTFTTYTLAGIMREQVCIYHVPLAAHPGGADRRRGAERHLSLRSRRAARLGQAGLRAAGAGRPAGDCIDCNQCVAVCPTGIDIRDGAQLDCIQCGLCIDACDNVMAKIGRPTRLIAYDTETNVKRRMAGKPPIYRPVRARTLIYAALIVVVGGAMLWQLATRRTAEISVLHERAPLFVTLSDGSIRNAYAVRLLNKRPEVRPFALTVSDVARHPHRGRRRRADRRSQAGRDRRPGFLARGPRARHRAGRRAARGVAGHHHHRLGSLRRGDRARDRPFHGARSQTMSCCGVFLMSCDTPAAPRPRRPFELTGWMVAAMLVLFFGVIVSVNATILTVALRTMPGVETRSAYETSQHFNEEIARQHERDARGWKAAAHARPAGRGRDARRDPGGSPRPAALRLHGDGAIAPPSDLPRAITPSR